MIAAVNLQGVDISSSGQPIWNACCTILPEFPVTLQSRTARLTAWSLVNLQVKASRSYSAMAPIRLESFAPQCRSPKIARPIAQIVCSPPEHALSMSLRAESMAWACVPSS